MAKDECEGDAALRAEARVRAAHRERLDRRYVEDFARAIAERYPGCPSDEHLAIAEHACRKDSGRVGRSAAAKPPGP